MYTVEKYPAVVGMQSLIGVGGKAPHRWGNYFALAVPEIRVLNFWAENLKAAVKQGILSDGYVQVRVYTWEKEGQTYKACIVDDPRIPQDWYYNKLCYTGSRKPPVEIAKEIYDYLGDPDNELEQFTDPAMYHAKRGWEYNERGFVSYCLGSDRKTTEQLVEELLKKRKEVQ